MSHGKWIGVDLGGTNVRAGLVTEKGLRRLAACPIDASGEKKRVFAQLCQVIDEIMTSSVRGIGLGAPSLVDRATGVLQDTTNIPSWDSVPIRRWLEKRYDLPVVVDNDANCFALAELTYGAGRGCKNLVGLSLGTGLGAGVIANGSLVSGVLCAAGEFGMIPYRDSILEHYASGQFFIRAGKDGADLALKARAGSKSAQKSFDEFGQHLAFAIKVILYSFAPERIVIGGSIRRAYPLFSSALRASLQDFAFSGVLKKSRIRLSRLPHAGVLGAASLVREF